MTPINKSPWDDNGYDVSDHEAIEPAFGTISDLKELVNKAKKFDIDIMFDCVLNHVSTQNETFIKAINGDKKAQKHFIFRSGKKNNEPPSKLDSVFGGSAWEYVPKINKYYLHIFAKSQADVNWENPATRKKMISHVLFWQKLGIKMFRYNSIDHISKSDLTKNCNDYDCTIYTNGQKVHKYLQEIKDACANKEDVVFHFGEITSKNIDELIKNGRNDFDGVFIAPQFCSDKINRSKWTHDINYFIKLKRDLDEILTKLLNANILPVISFENHDESRANSRFGDDKEFRKECSTMLLATQIMLPGIPCIYQGQEIGMTNDDFDELDMFEDVANIDFVNKLSEKGASKKDILNILNRFARDKARTAMQWDSSKNAGFSKFDEKFEIQSSGFVKKFNADWKLVLKPVLDEENIKKTKDALDDLKFEIDERLSKLKFLYDANIPMKKVGQSEIVDDEKISNNLMDVMEDLTEKDEIKSTLSGSGYFFRVTLKKFAVLKKNFNDSKKQIQTLYDVKLKKAKDDYPEVGKDGKISQSKLKSYQNNVSELEDKKESSLSDLKTKYMESRAKLVANAEEAIRAINTLASSISSNQNKLRRAEDFMNSLGKGSYSKDVCDAWKESFLSLLSEEDNVVQKRVPEPKRESDKSYRLNGKLSFNFNNKDYFYTMNLLIVVR